jgi:hypothetical protein
VYVNTDHNHGSRHGVCYRVAQNATDYQGGFSHFTDYVGLAQNAVGLMSISSFELELKARLPVYQTWLKLNVPGTPTALSNCRSAPLNFRLAAAQ